MSLFHHPDSIEDPLDQAISSGLTWDESGLKVGFGFFETLLAHQGFIEATQQHFARLKNSCDTFNLRAPTFPVFQKALQKALESADLQSNWARLRYSVTSAHAHPSGVLCIAEAEAFTPYTGQASLTLLPWNCSSLAPMVGHKSLSYANQLWGLNYAKSLGFDEGLWLNEKGEIAEACTSNVFWFKGETLYTPALSTGCLPGIGRQMVIKVAEKLNLHVEEGHYPISQLLNAKEAFLTSSLRGIQSIQRLKTEVLTTTWNNFNRTLAIKAEFQQFIKSQSVHETKIK